MRQLEVYRNRELAGILTEHDRGHYSFRYTDAWYTDPAKPPVSLTLPKTAQQYESDHLFPFFFNILSEGVNRALQSRAFQIDETDDFGLLSATARTDTVGPITVKPMP
ncbi:MAG TPA: HipA N-terminal domain-containing protein [Chitinophagaceae bacterium]|nr:HipA N-terminal domain-containing protein [Chitinophagaceae bacterium]